MDTAARLSADLVGMWLIMVGMTLWSWVLMRRGKLYRSRAFLRVAVCTLPMGYIAVTPAIIDITNSGDIRISAPLRPSEAKELRANYPREWATVTMNTRNIHSTSARQISPTALCM